MYIPNALSPAAPDPEDQVVKVYGQQIIEDDFSFRIYNRWGQIVYETSSFVEANTTGWSGESSNGENESIGVYHYTLSGRFRQRKSISKTWKHKSNKVRKLIYTLVGILISSVSFSGKLTAQDPHFSQYYANPLYLNPAMTGLDSDVYFGLNYRSQWKSLDLPFEIAQLSMVYPLLERGSQFKHRGGLGMSIYQESAGEAGNFKTSSYTISGAYNLFLKEDASQMISVGLQGGFISKQIDFNNLTWGSQYDSFVGFDANITPSLDLGTERTTFPVIHAGVVWYFDQAKTRLRTGVSGFMGFAVSNLNQPDESLLDGQGTESPLPRLFKITRWVKLKNVTAGDSFAQYTIHDPT